MSDKLPAVPWAVGVSDDLQSVTLVFNGNGVATKLMLSPSMARAISSMLEASADWVDPEEEMP